MPALGQFGVAARPSPHATRAARARHAGQGGAGQGARAEEEALSLSRFSAPRASPRHARLSAVLSPEGLCPFSPLQDEWVGEELSRLQRLAKLVPQQNYGEEVLAARVPEEGHLRAPGAARAPRSAAAHEPGLGVRRSGLEARALKRLPRWQGQP